MKGDMELAVVTGAGSGIGRAVTLELSRLPITVLAVGRRLKPLEETAAMSPGTVLPLSADVSTGEGRKKIIEAARRNAPVRYLVHGAGIFAIMLLTDIKEETWRPVIGTNLEGRLFLTQGLLPYFADGARVLFVGSRSARRARKGAGTYCISMAASEMLCRCLQVELAERGVFVISAIPGSVDTHILDISVAADPKVFPDGLEYQREKEEGKLIAPETVGTFFYWLLTQTSDDELVSKAWELEEQAHQHLWRRSY